MSEPRLAFLAIFALSALTALADIFVKKAAEAGRIDSPYLLLAFLIFGGSSYGWFFVLKHINLATLGGIYSLSTIILLVLAGVVLFGERLSVPDGVVIVMSFVSLFVFWRHL